MMKQMHLNVNIYEKLLLIYFFFMSFLSRYVVKIICFACQEAVARLEEIKKSIEAKVALRQSNLNPERPGQFENFRAGCFSIDWLLIRMRVVNV